MAVTPLEQQGAALLSIINGQPSGKTLTDAQVAAVQQTADKDYVTGAQLNEAIASVAPGSNFATSEQGDLADSAVQPGDDVLEVAQVRTVSASTTLVIEDRGRFVDATATATITIPTNAAVAFDVGSIVTVQRLGAGAVTIAADTGVTLNGVSAGSGSIGAQWQGVSLRKIGADAWVASGDIEVA